MTTCEACPRFAAYIALIVLLGITARGAEIDADFPEQVRGLTQLFGRHYLIQRCKIIHQPRAMEALKDIHPTEGECHLGIVTEAILYRKKEPCKAALMDFHWVGKNTGGLFGPPGGDPVGGLSSGTSYPAVIVLSFGQEAFPIVAENLLHVWSKAGLVEHDAIEAIVAMRHRRTIPVLRLIVDNKEKDALLAVRAILRLTDCLKGLPAYQILLEDPLRPKGYWDLEELTEYATDRKLPELKAQGAERDELIDQLCSLLSDETNVQIRAASAFALQYGEGGVAVDTLSEALRSDASPWVRAWSAVALRVIGTDKTVRVLVEAGETEKETEVKQVMEGKRLPLNPRIGIPRRSIFKPRQR